VALRIDGPPKGRMHRSTRPEKLHHPRLPMPGACKPTPVRPEERIAMAVPGLRRYVLSPVSGQPERPDVAAHGIANDGVAGLWYDDTVGMAKALAWS